MKGSLKLGRLFQLIHGRIQKMTYDQSRGCNGYSETIAEIRTDIRQEER